MATGADGLPLMTDAEKAEGTKKMRAALGLSLVALPAVGLGLGFAASSVSSTPLVAQKLALVQAYELGPLYAAGAVLARLCSIVNMYPMVKKAACMRGKGQGNLRANMFIYETLNAKDSAVVLKTEGAIGEYNRANRSVAHMVENSMPVVVNTALAGFVFPKATFVSVCVYALGRIMHQLGYSNKGYGSHGNGFALSALATEAITGLVTVVAIKAAMA